jgi:hypothetical protein
MESTKKDRISLTSLLEKETFCRTGVFDGIEYEDIPAKAIRQAAYKTLGLETKEEKPASGSGCGCNCGSGCC